MTLLDAPKFDEKAAKRRRNLSIAALAAAGVVVVVYVVLWVTYFHSFEFWSWPAELRTSSFMTTVEAGDFNKAFAMWYHDPDWQQHPDRYKNYDFNQFQKDWGVTSDYGKIRTHKILMSKSVGNGTIVGLLVNGDTAHPLFLRVDDKSKQIGFSPVELYVGP
jgi:hypothetical protein